MQQQICGEDMECEFGKGGNKHYKRGKWVGKVLLWLEVDSSQIAHYHLDLFDFKI